jgi:hypothetical protein
MREGDVAQRDRKAPARLAPVLGELELVQRLQQPVSDRAQQLLATREVVVERHALNPEL